MFIREMVLKDIEAVLPLYISYYNEQEDGCWNENTAAKGIHQVLSMEDSYGLMICMSGITERQAAKMPKTLY